MPHALIPTVQRHTSVPSVVPSSTTLLPGSVGFVPDGHLTPIDLFPSPILPQVLPYRDFSDTIVHRDPFPVDTEHSDNIFSRIVHPYDINAFEQFLSKHDLTYFYPLLITNLRNGFPLGEMPALTDTVVFKNHPSTLLYPDIVDKYLADELTAGRMSGPFSLQIVEIILRGPIFCSPLLISVQIQQPGMPDKLRVCRHLLKGDKHTPSMNSHIQKEDFPTRFDTALRVANIVGSSPSAGNTSSCFMVIPTGFTPSGPLLYEVHIWWPRLHQVTSGGLVFMGFTSGDPVFMGSHLVSLPSWATSGGLSLSSVPHLVAWYFMSFTSGDSLSHVLYLLLYLLPGDPMRFPGLSHHIFILFLLSAFIYQSLFIF